MEIERLIDGLKYTALSPYSFISYIILIIAVVFVTTRNGKLKLLSAQFSSLSEKERLLVIRSEYKTEPKQGLTAEEWLTERSQFLNFLLILSLILAVIIIAVVFITVSSASGRTNDNITPLIKPRLLSSSGNYPANVKFSYDSGKSLTAGSVIQGASPNDANLVFDVLFRNNKKEDIFPKKFQVLWFYHHGYLSSVGHGEPFFPVAKYVIDMPVDTEDTAEASNTYHEKEVVFSPIVSVPGRNESGPGATVIRLQLYYHFEGKISWHPCSDWDIYFKIFVVYDDGTLMLFPLNSNDAKELNGWQSWKKLVYTSKDFRPSLLTLNGHSF
jgi:hypothetical protein